MLKEKLTTRAPVILFAAFLGCMGCARLHGPVEPSSTQLFYHVSPNGADTNPGTREQPFATLECARDAIRELKTQSGHLIAGCGDAPLTTNRHIRKSHPRWTVLERRPSPLPGSREISERASGCT
ncbi:MAG: hypothetical protein HN742_07740 [Lentisphaerae bacterium]|jgi:hypothetical protein|nr:hypothetical protein [Lentisphaerota bacterium]MBT4818883.1 hypothetical protein [Lentisphaerota bacterium]MBT5608621.1 hypothetical protein [Lentisphaerota bacterium]MBT7055852.1 hypothetical protein [Lentisphaerota bacterium]MBT7841748.1 hypothetical protein [Lentisphaerota bacterium]